MNGPGHVLFILLVLLFAGLWIAACAASPDPDTSTFAEEEFSGSRYRLARPESFNGSTGSESYPLIVYLHDAGLRGNDNRGPVAGLGFLGSGESSQAAAFRSRFPSFVYIPQCPAGEAWEGKILDRVVATIAHLMSSYPVDRERIYLIGYSMGGSGTYALAQRFLAANGRPVAGIIRLAGQNEFPPQVHAAVAQSGVWLHIGLEDTKLRIDRAREAYALLKRNRADLSEEIQATDLNGHPRTTRTLTGVGGQRFKLSEYSGAGHGISHLPFADPAVLTWLFAQRSQPASPLP